MIEADRDKLVKILRMFSSDHDGEVASAARRAHELVKTRALDWDDLIIPVRRSASSSQRRDAPRPESDEEETTLINKCVELDKCLTQWEQEFITSISASIIEWGRLTDKQRNVLDRIVNKLKLQGMWDTI